jgi:hypothetical protein
MSDKIAKLLTHEEANNFCAWLQDELTEKEIDIKELNLQNGMLKISCEQKAGLLESCEIALNERDQQNEALLAQLERIRELAKSYMNPNLAYLSEGEAASLDGKEDFAEDVLEILKDQPTE